MYILFMLMNKMCERCPLLFFVCVNALPVSSSVSISIPSPSVWNVSLPLPPCECWLHLFSCVNDVLLSSPLAWTVSPLSSPVCVLIPSLSVWTVLSSLLTQCDWCSFFFTLCVNSVPIPCTSLWMVSLSLQWLRVDPTGAADYFLNPCTDIAPSPTTLHSLKHIYLLSSRVWINAKSPKNTYCLVPEQEVSIS